jgi:RimJ/RimL family protein N-acetyltransferase
LQQSAFDRFETERLTVRALTLDDVGLLVALDADPAVMRYVNGGNPTPRAEMQAIVRESLGHRWMAFDRSTRAFVGWFALRPSNDEGDERELGYRLRREAWGKGLATEGSRALITHAFTHLGVRRVWAQTMTVNLASRRVMEHCGLRYVRTFFLEWTDPIDGSEHGDVEYELLQADWEAAWNSEAGGRHTTPGSPSASG